MHTETPDRTQPNACAFRELNEDRQAPQGRDQHFDESETSPRGIVFAEQLEFCSADRTWKFLERSFSHKLEGSAS